MSASMVVNVHEIGGPDALTIERREVDAPGPGQVKIQTTHVGLNFIDVYFRSGLYPQSSTPFVPGCEAAGDVIAIGPDVDTVKVGDRVAYVAAGGAYAEQRLIDADRLVQLPEGISNQTAAALILKGMTVHYLFKRSFPIQPGQLALFHAAAGGVGLIACQWAKALGVRLVGTAGNEAKCQRAIDMGATACLNYRDDAWVAQARDLTNGAGFSVVYDSVGKATFDASLDCLAPFGSLISFGNASGPVTDVSLGTLAAKGSLYVQRPTLFHYIAERHDLLSTASDLFDVVLAGQVKPIIAEVLPMTSVADAHRALEARETTGSVILTF